MLAINVRETEEIFFYSIASAIIGNQYYPFIDLGN